jgi:hypothetical protein
MAQPSLFWRTEENFVSIKLRGRLTILGLKKKCITQTNGDEENMEERGRKLAPVLQGSSSVMLDIIHLSQAKVQSKKYRKNSD